MVENFDAPHFSTFRSMISSAEFGFATRHASAAPRLLAGFLSSLPGRSGKRFEARRVRVECSKYGCSILAPARCGLSRRAARLHGGIVSESEPSFVLMLRKHVNIAKVLSHHFSALCCESDPLLGGRLMLRKCPEPDARGVCRTRRCARILTHFVD